MTHPILALFTRAVREDCGGKSSYLTRAGLAGMIMLFLLSIQITSGWAGAPGLVFFKQVAYINFFFITLAGVGYFSSAITEEKEEMTLGLLRMTGLSPLSILLGKSTSRLFGASLLLLSQIPFTLLAVTLGGVSAGQIAAAYCTLAAYVFLLSNLALLCSVLSKRTGGSALLTGLLLSVFLLAPGFIRTLISIGSISGRPEWVSALDSVTEPEFAAMTSVSPYHRLGEIFGTGFAEGPVGRQVLANTGAGIFFFLLAWAAFDRVARGEADSAPARGALARRNRFLGPGRAWRKAILWKDFHFLTGGLAGVIARILLLALAFGFVVWMVRSTGAFPDQEWRMTGYATMFCAYVFLICDLAIAASRIFKEEVKWQTLASLGTLPLSTRQWAGQKAAASLIAALPAVGLFFAGAILTSGGIIKDLGANSTDVLLTLFVWGLDSIFFLLLVTLLSLFLKRGGLPVAIAAFYLGNMFCGIWLRMAVQNVPGFLSVASIFLLLGIGILARLVEYRLEHLIGED